MNMNHNFIARTQFCLQQLPYRLGKEGFCISVTSRASLLGTFPLSLQIVFQEKELFHSADDL